MPVFLIALTTPLANPGVKETFREYVADVGRIFHNRRLVGLLCITGITFILLYGPIITCFPVLADGRFGSSPAAIGGAMAFSSVGAAFVASRLGILYGRFSPRVLLLASQGLYLASLLTLTRATGLGWTLAPVLLFGAGQGLNIPNVQAQLLATASATQRASVMAVNGMLLRFGQSLAPVSFSLLMAAHGLEWGFYGGMLLACAIALLTFIFVPRRSRI